MRITAALDKCAHCRGRFRLAEQHAVPAAPEDLSELPRIEADIDRFDAFPTVDGERSLAAPSRSICGPDLACFKDLSLYAIFIFRPLVSLSKT